MKKFTRLVLSLSLILGSLTLPASAVTFTDVPGDAWFHDAVMGCAGKGYVSGVGNDQFMPDGKLTYAQIFTMFTNAFYKAEKQSYEDGRRAEMDAYFGGEPEWWSYNAYYFMDNGLLKDTNVNIQISVSANSPISRYDVVQVANNILKGKGITVSEAQKTEAQAKIADWSSVPSLYREAVASCVALGIINGYSDHSFGGNDSLTRAQACVILDQLEKVVLAGPQSGNSSGSSSGTSTDGVLANGKPITEENVLAIMAEIEKEYPTGTLWTETGTPGTAYNPNKVSTPVKNLMETYNINAVHACGGFATMVSDLVFGYDNPCRKLDDLSEIRPGDIIIKMKGNTPAHVMIAMASPMNDKYTTSLADGNNNGKVVWPSADDANLNRPNNTYTWVVYTRYPD